MSYEWLKKGWSEAILSPLLEEEEEEVDDTEYTRAASNSSSFPALTRHGNSSISSSRRRLRVEHERRLLRLLKDSRSTTDSEVTDYDYGARPLSSHDDDDNFGENGSAGDCCDGEMMTKRRTGVISPCAVVVVTFAAVSLYLTALVESVIILTVAGTVENAASAWALGVAGATCLLTSALIWTSEIRLSHAVSLRFGVKGLHHLARRLSDEIRILAKEKDALLTEVGRCERRMHFCFAPHDFSFRIENQNYVSLILTASSRFVYFWSR